MKGLLVDDEPAFHLHIPSLNPAYKFAASPALASEHSSHELEPKFQGALSFPSSNCTCMPSSEEKSPTGLACFDKYMCNLAELSSWDMHHLGSMIVPEGDKRQTMDESMCRRMGATNGDNSQGSGHVGDLQASMEAMKVNHMPGFKYYMGIERDYGSNIQAPIAPLMGRHPGSDDGNYVDDHPGHASMFALSCMSPPGDNSFWRFLPSNHEEHSTDFFSSDEFRMYEFKVRRCMRGRSHDWTECPFAHPGEKARRRDPRRFHYSGTACPDFRRGTCRRGDSCELSHGVFECWLHPARYRTQLCKDGKSCKRRVCFFAHSSSQLRYVSPDLIPDNGFTLRSPLASPSTDAMASYSDVLYKHLPFFANNSSPVRQGSPGGYGGDVLFDDFSPVNIHGFPHDGMHEDFFSFAVHSKRAQNDKTFENFNGKNGHGRGVSMDDISNHVKLNSHSYMPSSNGYHLAEEFDHDGSHGHSLYPYTCSHPSPDSPSLKTSQAHVNLRNQLALASLTSNIDQIMSPTSTLIGHVFSPPLLSPPLSPTDSPPVSPGAAFSSWSTLSRKLATLSGQPLSHGLAPGMDANPMIANGTSPSVSQFHASLLANLAHSNGAPALFANTRGPSPLSTNSLADKKQELDRLSSMPTSQELTEDESLQTDAYPAHHAMAHLISTLQRMEVRGATTNVKNGRRPYSPQSSRNMPKSRIDAWDGNGVASNQRVESGQGLRAKIYGKIGRDAGVDNENPDLGWVNELVK